MSEQIRITHKYRDNDGGWVSESREITAFDMGEVISEFSLQHWDIRRVTFEMVDGKTIHVVELVNMEKEVNADAP